MKSSIGTPRSKGKPPSEVKLHPSQVRRSAQSVAGVNPETMKRRQGKIRLVMDRGR